MPGEIEATWQPRVLWLITNFSSIYREYKTVKNWKICFERVFGLRAIDSNRLKLIGWIPVYAWDASHSRPSDDHFLTRFSLVPILSFPRRSVTFSLTNTRQARWEQKHRDGPPGIYRVSTLLHWYHCQSSLLSYISASCFIKWTRYLFVFHSLPWPCQSGRVFYCYFVIRLLKSHQV